MLYTKDSHAITLRSIQWAESRGPGTIVPERSYPYITSNIQYASYGKVINGTCSSRREQCFQDRLRSVYKKPQVSHEIYVSIVAGDCIRTLFVILWSTSLQQRQAIIPTIPKAIDTIATTLSSQKCAKGNYPIKSLQNCIAVCIIQRISSCSGHSRAERLAQFGRSAAHTR